MRRPVLLVAFLLLIGVAALLSISLLVTAFLLPVVIVSLLALISTLPARADEFQDLADSLRKIPESESAEFIQNEVYEAGKRHFAKEELRQWFKTLYEVLLGSEQGPRMGAFIKLYGRDNVVRLIDRALAGEDLSRAA